MGFGINDVQGTIDHIANSVVNEAAAKAGGKGGWLSAIAEAMGKAMGIQAARVVALSAAIADNASQRGGDDPKADAKLAAEGQALNAQFSAASQELNFTTQSFSTALKSIGESMANMARKN